MLWQLHQHPAQGSLAEPGGVFLGCFPPLFLLPSFGQMLAFCPFRGFFTLDCLSPS